MGPVVSTNDSVHMPPPWNLEGPCHPEDEGRLINISLAIKSFLYAWAQQNYVLMLVDRCGLSPASKRELHTSLRLLTALSLYEDHANTASTLGRDNRGTARGLLVRVLNILLFIEIDVKLNHGNSCLWPITALLIGVKPPMVCGYRTAQMILTVLCVIMLLT